MTQDLNYRQRQLLKSIASKRNLSLCEVDFQNLHLLSSREKEELEDALLDEFSETLDADGEPTSYGEKVDDLIYLVNKTLWPGRWRNEGKNRKDIN